MGLEVFGAVETAQVRDELVFVAGGEQGRDEQHVRHPVGDGRDCRLAGLDQDKLRSHQLADDPPEDSPLACVRLDC
jgi:hypothetical protein